MDKSRKNKSIMYLLSTIISWVVFLLLIIIVLLLGIYFLSSKMAESKGENPSISVFTIVSPSMVPSINVYDVVINKRVDKPEDIKIGDVITFISTAPATSGMTITHRVKDILIENGEYSFVTRGDNNIIDDNAPALYSNVIGKQYMLVPKLGYLQRFVSSKIGWLVVVVIPALLIIIRDIIKIVKISKVKAAANKENTKMVNEVINGGVNYGNVQGNYQYAYASNGYVYNNMQNSSSNYGNMNYNSFQNSTNNSGYNNANYNNSMNNQNNGAYYNNQNGNQEYFYNQNNNFNQKQ